jgi:hypothetical protein
MTYAMLMNGVTQRAMLQSMALFNPFLLWGI